MSEFARKAVAAAQQRASNTEVIADIMEETLRVTLAATSEDLEIADDGKTSDSTSARNEPNRARVTPRETSKNEQDLERRSSGKTEPTQNEDQHDREERTMSLEEMAIEREGLDRDRAQESWERNEIIQRPEDGNVFQRLAEHDRKWAPLLAEVEAKGGARLSPDGKTFATRTEPAPIAKSRPEGLDSLPMCANQPVAPSDVLHDTLPTNVPSGAFPLTVS